MTIHENGKLIYVVEDNTDIRELIAYLLGGPEFNLTGFGNVKDFREKMQDSLPDLIIMDVMLPDGNGVDVCKELKSATETRHVPVILMSANLSNKARTRESEAEDFIAKPFDIDDFMLRIQRLIA